MLDEYDYEYIDDDDATLELEDVAERLKRFVGSLNHDHHDMHTTKFHPPIISKATLLRSADYQDLWEEDHHLLEHYEPLVTAERRRRNSGHETRWSTKDLETSASSLTGTWTTTDGEDLDQEETRPERSANWATSFKGVGGVFQKLGPSSFQSNYYGQTPTPRPSYAAKTTTTTPAPTCKYVPKTTCKKVPRQECRQVVLPCC